MWRVEIIPQAKDDIQKTVLWYNEKQLGIGKLFRDNVRSDVSLIQQIPMAFPKRFKDIRAKVMQKFPFVIHYYIDLKEHKLIILAVFHVKLNPIKLKKRFN